ncbi:MAG: hypothetical protein JWN04_6118, partial [Myxococcaceae bacterium]|nr:hypothetical protein [Myxococcaceae bacterium]
MTENKNLPGAGDRTLSKTDAHHQEQAYGLVMAIVPATFIILV